MLRKILIAVAALVVIAGLVVLVLVVSYNPPRDTVRRFLTSVEKRSGNMLTDTLSSDPEDVALIVQTLSPDAPAKVRLFLKDSVTDAQLQNLEKAIKAMPEVASVTYVPSRQAAPGGLKNSEPAKLDLTLTGPQYFNSFSLRIAKTPEISSDPATSRLRMEYPVSDAVRAYLSRVPAGLKFTDLKYKSTVISDRASVIITDGKILKLNDQGKMVPVSLSEFTALHMFPIGYTLKKKNGKWYITSFPNVQMAQ
jgi:hypothetical protein